MGDRGEYGLIIGVAEWQVVIVLITLIVVRSLGYRLVRETSDAAGAAPPTAAGV